jgi:hypothetical protein
MNPKGEIDHKMLKETKNMNESALFKFLFEMIRKNLKNQNFIEHLESLIKSTVMNNNDTKYLAFVWNCVTSQENVANLIEISNKNYQFFLTKISLVVIDCLSETKFKGKIFEIFDIKFFNIFLDFEGGKFNHGCINQIIVCLNLQTIL